MRREGYGIPFAVFLGIDADKVPDIDLNFSGEYQPKAHEFILDYFGRDHVFRAGTISSVKDQTAYGYVKNYLQEKNLVASRAEIDRLVKGISGTKRTTGQHPGGLVILPKERDIHEFTPIQYPANDTNADSVTTHYNFNSLHDRLIKLDILGHDDPTALHMLQQLTGLDPKEVPINDPETLSLVLVSQGARHKARADYWAARWGASASRSSARSSCGRSSSKRGLRRSASWCASAGCRTAPTCGSTTPRT